MFEVNNPAIKLIKHPSRTLIIGKAGSGKTTVGVNIVQWLRPQVDELVICSPTFEFQPTWDPVRKSTTLYHDSVDVILKLLKDQIVHAIGDDKHKIGRRIDKRRLIVFDDVSYEKAINQGNKGFFNALAYNARHWNISLLVMCHKIANVGAGMRENLQFLVLFNTINRTELEKMYLNFGITLTKKALIHLFNKTIWEKIESEEDKYPFLFVDVEHGKVYFKFQYRIITKEAEQEQEQEPPRKRRRITVEQKNAE